MHTNIKKLYLTFLFIVISIATFGQTISKDSLPKGSFMLTTIIDDKTKTELNLRNTQIEQYKVFGKNSHVAIIVGKYIIMELLPQITFNDTIGKGEFSARYSEFKDNKLTRRTYNNYSKIFPQETWLTEIYENNISTRLFYNTLKCIKTEENAKDSLQGVYEYIEEGKQIFIAYSKDCYFTFFKKERERELWIGATTNIIAKNKDGYIIENEKSPSIRIHTQFIGDSILELKEEETNNIKRLRRSEFPYVLKEVFEHVNLENFSWHRMLNDTNTTVIYQVVEKQPEFPGGMKALMKYLRDNIQYPRISRENNSQGKSFVNFIISTDGSIQDVETIRSSGDIYLDAEAVRVIKGMPNWQPAIQQGKPVKVRFTLPVTFKLQ